MYVDVDSAAAIIYFMFNYVQLDLYQLQFNSVNEFKIFQPYKTQFIYVS